MQCAIDGCKRVYAVDVNDEIKRIRAQKCMSMDKDYPKFMKYTHKIPVTKNGRERDYAEIKKDRDRVAKRIDEDIVCPMNWMQECLDKIQMSLRTNTVDTLSFLVEKPKVLATNRQMAKIRSIVEDLDAFTRRFIAASDYDSDDDDDALDLLTNKNEEVYQVVSNMKIAFPTMHRLVSTALGYDGVNREDRKYKQATKYTVKMLNVLYNAKKELFLSCFTR